MKKINFKQLYKNIKHSETKYIEDVHCPLMLEILPKHMRISKFCAEALVSDSTVYTWINKYPVFKRCFELGRTLARETWELEEQNNKYDKDWDRKAWQLQGTRHLDIDSHKVKVCIQPGADPWEQYQQILKQARHGDFSAAEVKQLMEAINVGTRVYEIYKLQVELDKMKADLSEMSQRNGNNIVSIVQAQNLNTASL